MRKPIHLGVALAMLASLGITTPSSADAACADGATLGCFDAPFSENGTFDENPPNSIEEAGMYPTAVSIVALPDGRFVYWDGLTDLEESPGPTVFLADYLEQADRSRILDLGPDLDGTPLFLEPANNDGGGDQLFCADQRLTYDGRVVAAGGTLYANQQTYEGTPLEGQVTNPIDGQEYSGMGSELFGSKDARAFAAAPDEAGAWSALGRMRWGRWYPTMLTLPDGDLYITGGVEKLVYNSSLTNTEDPTHGGYGASDPLFRNVEESEVLDLDTGTWSDNPDSARKSLPLFARLHMIPNGEIVFLANGQQFNPMGQDVDQLSWNNQAAYDDGSKTWRDLGLGKLGARSGAADVMMRLEPNGDGEYDAARVLMAGGTLGVSPGTFLATPFTEIVTLADDGAGTWNATTELGPMLNSSRWFSTAVGLPSGDVLVFNGGTLDDVIAPGSALGTRQVELFNGSEWVPLASGARDRIYHNSAILLKDGSVLVGGHSPINMGYGAANSDLDDQTGLVGSNLRDPSFERFYPPYLYAGERPVIRNVSSTTVTAGDHITIETSIDAPDGVEYVLSRMPAQTHVTDADARTVQLDATGTNHSYTAQIPAGTVVPPGYYYLFAMSDAGVPSIAEIINVTP